MHILHHSETLPHRLEFISLDLNYLTRFVSIPSSHLHWNIESLLSISLCSKCLLQPYFRSLYIIFDFPTCFNLSFVAFSVILQMVCFRWTDFNFKSFLVINNALLFINSTIHSNRWLNSARPCLCWIYSSNLFSFLSSFHSCCTKIHYNRCAILASDRNNNSFLCFPWYRWTVHYIYPWPRIQGNISIAYPLSIY